MYIWPVRTQNWIRKVYISQTTATSPWTLDSINERLLYKQNINIHIYTEGGHNVNAPVDFDPTTPESELSKTDCALIINTFFTVISLLRKLFPKKNLPCHLVYYSLSCWYLKKYILRTKTPSPFPDIWNSKSSGPHHHHHFLISETVNPQYHTTIIISWYLKQ